MVYYVDAICADSTDLPGSFERNRTYPLAIKERWWTKKISVYKRRGYYDAMAEGSLHHFENWTAFNNHWNVIQKEEEE